MRFKVLYKKLSQNLPYFFGLGYSKEILQLFINEEGVETFIGISNFPSFFGTNFAKERKCKISIRNQYGKLIATKTIMLEKFGSRGLSVNEFFADSIKDAPYGIVSIKLKTDKNILQLLGNTSMHFYSFFKDSKGSVGLTHPQSRLYDKKVGKVEWHSRALIDPKNIKKIIAFHINPSKKFFTNNIFVASENGTKHFIAENSIKPLHVIKNIFPIENISEDFIHLGASAIMHNSMPLVFTYFKDDTFTVSHP